MKAKVAVLKTSPQTALEDYERLMKLAEFEKHLSTDKDVILKVNISWHHYFPSCSTQPWQYEGVVKTLLGAGFKPEQLVPAHNRTVVVNAKKGIINNRYDVIDRKYGLKPVHLYEPPVKWIVYHPKRYKFSVLHKIFPDGVKIPELFIGKSVVHLPTVKTHVFTTITGAMKNAFGGLLSERRHWTHGVIHETLVDLLKIQKEIHTGLFAVMDGTVCGDGAGPRAMRPCIKNYILASADQVAIDAVSAKMQGFDPLSLGFIRLAHEAGLGIGDIKDIEVVGEDITGVNFRFCQEETFASRGQKAIYWGPLRPFEKLLLRSPIVPWSYVASRFYYDFLWFNIVGRKRVKDFMKTDWGKLFLSYK